nr:nucleoside kinase [uncultured Agathobaculum sp.]
MAEYTLKYINHRARYDAAAFIEQCEQTYHEQIEHVADVIAQNSIPKPIVLLNGPSSSGKTTTCARIARALAVRGIHAEMISMDDYYRTIGTYEVPPDPENGVPDLESPECMNLPLLSQHLAQLAAGEEIAMPRFDFETRSSQPGARTLRLDPDEVVLIEGIHSFNPVIMGDLAHTATSVYLSVASAVVPEEGARLEPQMLRFLRRAMRDSLFRASPVEETIRQWNSVCRGERLYIAPYRGQADLTVDTFLPYELCALMQQLEPQLCLHKEALTGADLAPVGEVLGQVASIDYAALIPADSVLHEFVG